MTREIKVRQAWQNNDTGIISYSYWTLDQLKNGISGVDNHTLLADDLFTGLLDRNGKEIYEGDVLRRRTYKVNGSPNGGQRITVKWVRTRITNGWNVCSSKEYEVIGNIHEHPHLQNGEKQQ